jgi:hypothetical protein
MVLSESWSSPNTPLAEEEDHEAGDGGEPAGLLFGRVDHHAGGVLAGLAHDQAHLFHDDLLAVEMEEFEQVDGEDQQRRERNGRVIRQEAARRDALSSVHSLNVCF